MKGEASEEDEDGEMRTPVPRAYCFFFSAEPILAQIRRLQRKLSEFVFLDGAQYRTLPAANWTL